MIWLLPRVVTGTLAVSSRFFSLFLYLVVMIWLMPKVVTGTLAVSCMFFSLLLYLVVMIWLLPRVVTGTLAVSSIQVLLPALLPGGDDLVVAKSGDRDPGSLLQVLLSVPGVELLGCNGTRHWAHRLTAHLMSEHVVNFNIFNRK
jgi:hypothetical protein